MAGGGWLVQGQKGSNGSSSMFGEELGKVRAQRGPDGRGTFPGATNSSIY